MDYVESAIDYLNRTFAAGIYHILTGSDKKAAKYQERAKALYDLIVNEWEIALNYTDIGCEIEGAEFTFTGFVKAAP